MKMVKIHHKAPSNFFQTNQSKAERPFQANFKGKSESERAIEPAVEFPTFLPLNDES